MKKIISIFTIMMVVAATAFAALPEASTTNLTLDLTTESYVVGFSSSQNYTNESSIALAATTNSDLTVDLTSKTFYFFYKALTDKSNVKFSIAITPLKLTTVVDPAVPTADQTINFTATITKTATWDGEDISTISLDTTATATSTAKLIKASTFDEYLAKGIGQVVIASTEDLEKKEAGSYQGTITVTLSAV